MLEIDASQNGKGLTVEIGEAICLRLSENPSTGYRWFLCSEIEPILTIEKDAFSASGSAPGAFGSRTWQFVAMQAGHVDLQLERRRSWENRAAETFTVSIHAKAG